LSRIKLAGGSYTSQSVNADAQRTVNLYPERIESGDGNSDVVLYPSPGLKKFLSLIPPVPPPAQPSIAFGTGSMLAGASTPTSVILTDPELNFLAGPCTILLPITTEWDGPVDGTQPRQVTSVTDLLGNNFTSLVPPTAYQINIGGSTLYNFQLWGLTIPAGTPSTPPAYGVTINFNRARSLSGYDGLAFASLVGFTHCASIESCTFLESPMGSTHPSGLSVTTTGNRVIVAIATMDTTAIPAYIPAGTYIQCAEFIVVNFANVIVAPYGTNDFAITSPAGTYAPTWDFHTFAGISNTQTVMALVTMVQG
jgi:hypothetical protein